VELSQPTQSGLLLAERRILSIRHPFSWVSRSVGLHLPVLVVATKRYGAGVVSEAPSVYENCPDIGPWTCVSGWLRPWNAKKPFSAALGCRNHLALL